MATPSPKISSYWQALRRQPAEQIFGRLRYSFRTRLYRLLPALGFPHLIEQACERAAGAVSTNPSFVYPEADALSPGGYFGNGRFRFLEQDHQFGNAIDWNPQPKSLLWRFHLHYFDWAPRLAAEGRTDELYRQVQDWIASNSAGRQPGWHPYPTSLRIVNWTRALSLCRVRSDRALWIRSLARQAAFLERNLEFHLGVNHLIENAYSLLVCGLFFQDGSAPRWERRGLDLLTAEFSKQVLPDGGHCERSLFYHFRMNLRCREALQLLRANGRAAPSILAEVEVKMSRFLEALLHEDGNIPLFHDSQLITDEEWSRFQRLRPETS